MKTIIRNFLNVLKRFKMATALNVAGLSVAFAAFLVIMMQIEYEWNFDRCYKTSDRIYRVDRVRSSDDVFAPVIPRGTANAVFASSPHVIASSLINGGVNAYLTVGDGAERKGFREKIQLCYPDLPRILDLDLVEGDPDCMKDPEKALIPQSMARRLFGPASVVGKQVHLQDFIWMKGDVKNITIGAVYQDLPKNTQFDNVIYTAMDKTGENDWYSQNCLAYVLLDSPGSKKVVEDNFNTSIDFTQYDCPKETRVELVPLADIYYRPGQMATFMKIGNPDTLKLLVLIALLVVVVAGINFTNFSTSLAPIRIKSINTQKVLGSSVVGLRWALVAESLGIAVLACLLSFGIIALLNNLRVLSFVEADTMLGSHAMLCLLMLGIALLVGLIAGVYPAYYMTSFAPALVLKGSFGLSASGRKLRTALIGFQYVVSIGLIVGACFIQLQNNYLRNFNLGMKTDQIAIVPLTFQFYEESKDVYTHKLKEYAGIDDVAFSQGIVGGSDSYSMNGQAYKGETFYTWFIPVSRNFLKVMDIPVIYGRDFNETDEMRRDSVTTYIYSNSVRDKYRMQAGDNLDGGSYIAGFMGDVKMVSLRENNYDMALIMNKALLSTSYVRLKAGTNVEEALEHIRKSLAEIDPAFPFEVQFYDDVYDQLYQKEQYLKTMIMLFSFLAILISIVGVFGLVVFETQYRRKEIGLRKVHGATVGEILLMFNKIYMRIVLVCFAVAAPIAYYGVNRWLENFTYRTPIHWWTFALALLVILVITLMTVTFQNWRAANENPVNSIKSE